MATIGQSNLSIKGKYSRTCLMAVVLKNHQNINLLANTKKAKRLMEK